MRFGSVHDHRRFTPAQRAGIGADPVPGCNCREGVPPPPSLLGAIREAQGLAPSTPVFDALVASGAKSVQERDRRLAAKRETPEVPAPASLADAIRAARKSEV
jgi:hypothetical protein